MNNTQPQAPQTDTTSRVTTPVVRSVVVVQSPTPTTATASRQARARRAVVSGAVAFVLFTLVFALVVECVFPQLRDPEYGYREVRLRALHLANSQRPLVVMIGTSRTQNAIRPQEMSFGDDATAPLVFNFGQSGATPSHILLTLQRLRAERIPLHAVCIELHPITMARNDPPEARFADTATRLTHTDISRLQPYAEDTTALSRLWFTSRANPWHAQRLVVMSHIAPRWQPWQQRLDHQWRDTDAFGFTPHPDNGAEFQRDKRFAKTRAVYEQPLADLTVSEQTMRAYRDLVAECRAAGIRVAFYYTPEAASVRNWYSPRSLVTLAEFERMLTAELGCPVFAAPHTFAEDDFADGHHLLPAAATQFSRDFANQHLKPWLANGR